MGFHELHALQCGFCTPGMLMTGRALLDENPDPSEHEIRTAISGAICRCTGYKNIVAAVRWAAEHEAADATGGLEHGHHREPPQRTSGAPDRLRAPQAQGGRALHPRQGQLPRRHPPARDAARRDPAQPLRARQDRLDRHLAGARAPQRRRRGHGQGPRDARPGLDADDLLRHPGRAGRRQGALPGPGGGVRDRHRRVLRPRRAHAHRRRVRPAARGRQRAPRARRRRAAHPR